ncbi:MAG: hypothetical protein QNJ32_21180 [Xenococcaceae cyanobacterium MO_167.B27]|nr:hypothetical protein [Xenococcaceae cyanobacterium MO_167.B27]
MSKNISITINEANLEYLNSLDNRSKYINELIEKDGISKLEASMRAGYIAQSQSLEMKEEDLLWEVTVGDGLAEEGDAD